jgi:hypothetical protein
VWEQSGTANWVDLQGRVMQQREDRPDLLRVSADSSMTGQVGGTIDQNIVTGAVQLQTLVPNITLLRYHPDKGLGYNDQRGWEAWLGAGSDMPTRVLIYNAIVNDLLTRGVMPTEVNVNDPNAPFYSIFTESESTPEASQ